MFRARKAEANADAVYLSTNANVESTPSIPDIVFSVGDKSWTKAAAGKVQGGGNSVPTKEICLRSESLIP